MAYTFTVLLSGMKDLNMDSKYVHLAASIALCAGMDVSSSSSVISQNS